ncbi:MAG: TFIIB-type zinc finger domain-containing protein [Rhodobacterales bacterium]|nr:TFIIB-type zinc finger domain-containing protein [Rhodobacterales bacterium]
MAQSPPPAPKPSEHRFPCDHCGADFRFAPAQGLLICDHCGNQQPLDDDTAQPPPTAIIEQDFRAALRAQTDDTPNDDIEETRVLTCPNCAAQVEFDGANFAAECPFCATPVVTDTGLHRHIKPRGVLPFALEERDARKAMTDWLGKLWFAPNGLQEYAAKGRKLNGIYVPYWTYDADTKTRYSGERGTIYYVTRTVTRNGKQVQERVQKIRWNSTSGRVARWFDDILVLASKSLPKRYTDALEPWDLSALEPYRPEYLAGLRAEGYTVQLEEGYTQALAIMENTITRDIKFDIGGDRQRIHSRDTKINDVTFKHILLPVWLAAYKYRGKSYRFVVNGQNGRVQGARPYSAWKIAFAVTLGLAVAAGIGFFIAQNQ